MQDDAKEALAALADIPRYEERLTSRAAGLTLMVWGLAVPGIFLTYNLAAHAMPHGPWFALLWLPWVAAAIAVNGAIWHGQAISLRRDPETGKGLAIAVGFTAGFFALMAVAFFLAHYVFEVTWDVNAIMMVVTGAFAVVVGVVHRGLRTCGPPTIAAGVALTLLGLAVALSGLSLHATAFIGAAASGLAWFLPGLWATLKG